MVLNAKFKKDFSIILTYKHTILYLSGTMVSNLLGCVWRAEEVHRALVFLVNININPVIV